MITVKNPPQPVIQETGSWCFAAVEVMARAFYGFPALSQYEIARRNTEQRADNEDPTVKSEWDMANAMDSSVGMEELDGKNRQSQVVQLVRGQENAFLPEALGGSYLEVKDLTPERVRSEIDDDRIFVVGTPIHYLLVYGYAKGGEDLLVHDPLQRRTTMSLNDLHRMKGAVVNLFRGRS